MRVLESGATPSYSMGKNKKHKLRKTKEVSDSSDDGLGVPRCNHINMAVNVAAMRKGLIKQVYGECASCTNETSRKTTSEADSGQGAEASPSLEVEPTLWVCLQCGNQGCDRNSRDKHALKHYETPRSSCHCLVINTTTWTVWCYKCDDEVQLDQSKRLQESIDIIRKQAGLPQSDVIGRKQSQTGTSSAIAEQTSKPSTLTPRSSGVCSKVKGLSNLGNTCFFNAVMQNLTQTPCMEAVVVEKSKKGRLSTLTCKGDSDLDSSSGSEDSDEEMPLDLSPIEIVLSEAGPLTQTMIAFLQEMNNSTSRSSTVNPTPLFSQICKKAQRFRGFQQQDSHELLRYLLDNMRMEEIKRGQAGILKHFKLPENVNPKKVDDEMKIKIKEYGRQVKYTFVDSLFGGFLISTVTCEECKNISQIFESFLDLSLPVMEEKPQRPNQMLGGRKKDSTSSDHQEESLIEHAERPSRHLERKLKKQAKKEAKRKAKIAKNQVSPSDEPSASKSGGEVDAGGAEKEEEGGSKDQEEESSDPSDADVEDNLESDTSRCFGKLSLDNSQTEPSHSSQEKPEVDLTSSQGVDSVSSNSTDTLTSGTSTSTIKLEDMLTENRIEMTDASFTNQNHISGSDLKSADSSTKPTVNGESQNHALENGHVGGECFGNNCKENGVIENEVGCSNDIDSCTTGNIACDFDIPKIKHRLENGIEGSVIACDRTTGENSQPQNGTNRVNKEVIVNGESGHHFTTHTNTNEVTAKLGNLILEDSTLVSNVDGCQGENGTVDYLSGGSNCEKGSVSTPPLQHSKNEREVKKEALMRSKVTLGSRYQPTSRECTIMTCLHQFTSAELLTGNNKFGCAKCTQMKCKQGVVRDKKERVYSNAAKQYLIHTPPAVLTLHLKRFEQVGFSSRKVNRHVDFPFVLDLAPYCSSLCQGVRPGQKKILYALYGVVEHSGRLNAGHYTAYVKVRPNIGIIGDFLNSAAPSISDCIKRYLEQQNSTASLEEQEESLVDRLVPPGKWYHISDSRVSETTESTVQRAQAYLLFYERIY